MSRVGRMPITVPEGVSVDIKGGEVTVTGPKGTLSRQFNPDISITREGDTLIVSRPSDNRQHRSLHGLTRSLLANMVEGVSNGFVRELEIVGVGYRAEKAGDNLVIPSNALFRKGREAYVQKIVEKGKEPERAPVEVGKTTEDKVEILSGIEEGDVLLLQVDHERLRSLMEQRGTGRGGIGGMMRGFDH